MPVGGGGGNEYDDVAETGVDANATSTTEPVEVGANSLMGMYVKAASGTHATHIVTLQISPDGTNWFDTTHTITGTGDLHDIRCVAVEARVIVSTVEGGASTIDINLITR